MPEEIRDLLKILVACEESQRVCIELRKRKVEAYSCDLLYPSGGHPEWHIMRDVTNILSSPCKFITLDGIEHYVEKWDAIIAFPPCTDLANSGAACFEKKRKSGVQKESIEFFAKFLNADCEHIAVENPMNIISGNYMFRFYPDLCNKLNLPKKYTQAIQPWFFGDKFEKTTWLWLKNLPNLIPDVTEKPEMEYYYWTDKYGKQKREIKWLFDGLKIRDREARSIYRSKTFPGVAKAMAEQWTNYLKNLE